MDKRSFGRILKMPLFAKLKEALVSVAPVASIILILSFTPLVDLTVTETIVFAVSALFLILGIGFFNRGADLAMTPMGEYVGTGLTKSKKLTLLLSVCFVMGVLITIAEPDLSVLAEQVKTVINNALLIAIVGIGVGLFLLIAILKIVYKKDLSTLLLFFYFLLFSFVAILIEGGKGGFLALSFDSGGVTTGPITVPFIMALGVGIALTIGGKDAKENSFGLIALCSIGPILAVMVLSLSAHGEITYTVPNYSMSANFGSAFWLLILAIMGEVGKSLVLIVAFFFVLQITILKLPKQKIVQILIGIVYTFLGLVVFLTAVTVGFMPVGYKVGSTLAAKNPVILVVFAFVLGIVVVLAEPAIHVLNNQVEDITSGAVTKKEMMVALCIGVGISIGLSMLRIVCGFSLLYYLIPGYAISLGLTVFVPKMYTAIAFDSGGVASGPLTSSFILPLAIGACVTLCGENGVMNLAFGIVAMVAMTPLITIQTLGFRSIVAQKRRKMMVMKRFLSADDAQIIYFKKGDKKHGR